MASGKDEVPVYLRRRAVVQRLGLSRIDSCRGLLSVQSSCTELQIRPIARRVKWDPNGGDASLCLLRGLL